MEYLAFPDTKFAGITALPAAPWMLPGSPHFLRISFSIFFVAWKNRNQKEKVPRTGRGALVALYSCGSVACDAHWLSAVSPSSASTASLVFS